MKKQQSRREFLRVSALGSSFLVSISYSSLFGHSKKTDDSQVKMKPDSFDFSPFLKIDDSGKITFWLTKHEMGQGVATSLCMIIAEELDCDWDDIEVERAGYDPKFSKAMMGTTGGSRSVNNLWPLLREAGAVTREMLIAAAAKEWNVDVRHLKTSKSYVVNSLSGDKLSYGGLVQSAATLPPPSGANVKRKEKFSIVGKSMKSKLSEAVSTGKVRYGMDVELEGMLYASIERCPVFNGKLKDYNDAQTLRLKGVVQTIPIKSINSAYLNTVVKEGVAVIADSTWAAIRGRKRLSIDWDNGSLASSNIENLKEKLRNGVNTSRSVYSRGSISFSELEENTTILEQEYFSPYQIHAAMEPLNCTVHFKGDSCEAWTGTQSGERAAREIAKLTGLTIAKIKVNILDSGGAFGRRFHHDYLVEATYLSMKLEKPVKLVWTREDDTAHDHYHPFEYSVYRALLNTSTRKVIGWKSTIVTTGFNYSGDEIWEIPYEFQNIQTYRKFTSGILPTGAWRSVQEHSGCFGRESFLDQIAESLNKDPFQFRRELVTKNAAFEANQRYEYRESHRSKLQQICEFIEIKKLWKEDRPGLGKGIAFETYVTGTPCALIAYVSKDAADKIVIEKMTCVLHCGVVIHPHHAIGQVEGSIIFGLSALLYGGVEVENGVVLRSNFHDNKVLRINEVPEIDVHFIDSNDDPTGLGEPATPAVAPAVLNAIFDLTGERLTQLPLKL